MRRIWNDFPFFYGELHPGLLWDVAFLLVLTIAFFLASLVTMRRRLIK
ncbi:MAG: hypothetical protein AAB037_04340 [Chloroflexota bacterium]